MVGVIPQKVCKYIPSIVFHASLSGLLGRFCNSEIFAKLYPTHLPCVGTFVISTVVCNSLKLSKMMGN